jgi:hypothetical protein
MVPSESEFLLVATDKNPEDIKELSQFFNIEYIETFDLNFSTNDSRGYKNRLVNKLYKLTRK